MLKRSGLVSRVAGWVGELLLSRAVVILILGGGGGEGWFLPKQPTTELSSPVLAMLGSLHISLSIFSSRTQHDLEVASMDYGGVGVGEHTAFVPSQYMKYTQRSWDWLQIRGGYARGPREPAGGTELWREPEVLLQGGHQASSVSQHGTPVGPSGGHGCPQGPGRASTWALNGEAARAHCPSQQVAVDLSGHCLQEVGPGLPITPPLQSDRLCGDGKNHVHSLAG